MEVDAELEGLLATFPELKLQTGKGTVVCSLSRHEMPGRAEVVRAYVDGKKFKTLKTEKDFNFKRLEPYIVPSQKRKRHLFCALTNRYLNRKPAEVELHLRGRRYRRALENYNAGRLSLFEERLRKRVGSNGAAVRAKEEEMDEGGEEEVDDGDEEVDQEEIEVPPTTRVVHGGKRKRVAGGTARSSRPPTKQGRLRAGSTIRSKEKLKSLHNSSPHLPLSSS